VWHGEKGSIKCCEGKRGRERHMPTKNNILVQTSKRLPTISPIYWANPSISYWRYSQEKDKWENETCKSVKWLKGTKPEVLENILVRIGQVNLKNAAASDEVIRLPLIKKRESTSIV
jgi:hypothetical protein